VVVGPPPPLTIDFSADVTCDNQLGFDSCAAQAGTIVHLTASLANADSYAWSFGDNTTGGGSQVTHAWTQAGSYTVVLTATKGATAASKTRTFVISSPPPPKTKAMLLPWVSRAAARWYSRTICTSTTPDRRPWPSPSSSASAVPPT